MRFTAAAMCGAVLGTTFLSLPPATAGDATGSAADPVRVKTADIAIPAATGSSIATAGGGYVTAQLPTVTASAEHLRSFAMVGAKLPVKGMKPTDVELRVRTASGSWGGWKTLQADDSGPDSDTREGKASAGEVGTAPVWVDGATAVQARVKLSAHVARLASGKPLKLTMVDPGHLASDDDSTGSSTAGVGAPHIITRAQWGADEQATCPDRDASSEISMAVVHHTADSNAYRTVGEAKRQIRADQAFHIFGRGWCDLGYNFVVDKWGNVYEGRRHSITTNRIGAHAVGFNKMTLGVSMLGNYAGVRPSYATRTAVARVIAWKMSRSGHYPGYHVQYYAGRGSERYRPGALLNLSRVVGHRDVGLTTCPGDAGYALLNSIRVFAARYVRWGGTAPASHGSR